jgi:mannose-1-phosphate guanylyltransferase
MEDAPVSRFVEKPGGPVARELFQNGGLWNTMGMVAKARTLLALIRDVAPDLCRSFDRIRSSLGTSAECEVVEAVYRKIEPVNFSKAVLEAVSIRYSSHVYVLPVRDVYWSDWGSEHRIKRELAQVNHREELIEFQTA